MAHAQVGLPNRFNSKFPTSTPDPFIWQSPPGLKIYILRDSVTRHKKKSKNPVREVFWRPFFPFNLWERVSRLTSGARVPI